MIKKNIFITSPPRTGNNYLTMLINSYLMSNSIKNVYCAMSGHEHIFFKNDNKNVYNILILRNPKDILISQFIFGHGEVGFNHIDDRVMYFKNAFFDHLNTFINVDRENNYWVHFNDLVNNPENVLKGIINILGFEYDSQLFVDPNEIDNKHPWISDIYKNPFLVKRKDNEEYKKLYKEYSNIANTYDIEDANKKYNEIMNLFDHKRIM